MKAVNLIPADARRGSGASGSDAAVFGLLGGLALVLLGVALYVVTANGITEKRTQLAHVRQDAATTTATLAALKPYQDFATLESSRASTVKQLASSRFDWDRTMGDLSRVVGPKVWLTSLQGTVAPGVQLDGGDGGGGAAASFRGALPNPAVTLSGCAVSNDEVVRLVSRLRAMGNVTRVSLVDAAKPDNAGGASGSSSGSTGASSGTASSDSGCGSDHWPAFGLVVFYKALPTASASVGTSSTSGTTATAPATTPAASTTTPSSG